MVRLSLVREESQESSTERDDSGSEQEFSLVDDPGGREPGEGDRAGSPPGEPRAVARAGRPCAVLHHDAIVHGSVDRREQQAYPRSTDYEGAGDREENLRNAYRFYAGILEKSDDLIETEGIDAPDPEFVPRDPEAISVESVRELDLEAASVRTVIWATGFRFDFDWVEPATFDEHGYPVHDRGVTDTPGVYFLGLPWLHTGGSLLLFGVGGDAEYVTDHILGRLEQSNPS